MLKILTLDRFKFSWGELWDFTASAVGGKEIDSAILASAKSLRYLNSDNVSIGELIISLARILHERKQNE